MTQAEAAAAIDGLVPYHLISAASDNATNLKATPGIVGHIVVGNTSNAGRYLKLYDKATVPAPASDTGATVLVQSYYLPPASGQVIDLPRPLVFVNGIGFALVTGSTDSDDTSVSAGDVILNIGYR